MNIDIKKRIDAINNPAAIQYFFSLLKLVIDEAKLSDIDERLAINVRNDYRKRFSVNLNGRLILSIKDGNELALMINNEDLKTISNFPVLKTEVFEKQIPEASLVYFDFEVLKQNSEILKPLWLKSCLEYLPAQTVSQYRRHHIDELYKIAINQDTLNEYLAPATDTDKVLSFPEMINEFRIYLKNEDNILSDFKIFPVTSNSRWVWISDNQNILNDTIAHYEIIIRREKIYVEIHFEGNQSQKDWFNKKLSKLPDKINWFSWNKSKSIRYDETYTIDDEDILQKLAKALLYLEENLGNQLRKIKNAMNQINVKEEFLRWLIATDGVDNNYYTQQFGANLDRFKAELNEYEEVYKKDFAAELFVIDFNNLEKQIETIKNNIYGKSIEFSKYSKDKSNDRPRAILGKKNYLKFLNEYFENDDNLSDDLTNNDDEKMALNQILYGPPGTGKTYNTINKAISIINPDFDLTQDRQIVKKEFDRLVSDGLIVFTTFHQSMSYEDFIEGIKPITVDNKVLYTIEDGIFKNIALEANKKSITNFNKAYDKLLEDLQKINTNKEYLELITKTGKPFWVKVNGNKNLNIYTTADKNFQGSMTKEKLKSFADGINTFLGWEGYANGVIKKMIDDYSLSIDLTDDNSKKNFVLIIDEINRGNVSQIFGELITLIEEDKRLGKEEALEVTLPYSKVKFGVPPNLFIIGTMNTADRSVEALDTALRRRFSFEEMPPKTKVIEDKGFSDYDRADIMKKINSRIEVLLDSNHTLGHAYFIKENFKSSFENEIIPLLQEYFYNDYGKIGLVLGKGFVREKAITAKNDRSIFADFETKNDVDINKSYELIPFQEVDFDAAIQTLLV